MMRLFNGDPADKRHYRDRSWRRHPLYRTDGRDRGWKRHRDSQYKPVNFPLWGISDA